MPIKSSFIGGGYIGDDDFVDSFDQYEKDRTQSVDKLLRRRSMGDVEMPGTELAWLRSKLQQEKKMREQNLIMASNSNVFVLQQQQQQDYADEEDDDNDSVSSDVSDTDIIADHIVNIIEGRMGNFVIEELMERFGGGPAGKIRKKKENKEEYSIEVSRKRKKEDEDDEIFR